MTLEPTESRFLTELLTWGKHTHTHGLRRCWISIEDLTLDIMSWFLGNQHAQQFESRIPELTDGKIMKHHEYFFLSMMYVT